MKKKLITLFSLLMLFVCGVSAEDVIIFHETFNGLTTENTTKNALTGGNTDETGYTVGGGGSTMLCSIDGSMDLTAGRFKTKTLDLTGTVKLYVTYKLKGTTTKKFQIDIDKEGTSGMGGILNEAGGSSPTEFETKEFDITNGASESFIHFRTESGHTIVIDEIKIVKMNVGPSSDATIKTLTVNEEVLTATENVYSIELPNSYTVATAPVVITPNSDKAVVTVSSDANANTVAGAYTTSIAVPSNVTITVTPEDPAADAVIYTLNVTKAANASTDTSLSSVTVDGTVLTANEDGNYTMDIPYAYAGELLVAATATDDGVAEVTITNNNPTVEAGASATVTISVKAESGATKDYTVTITRAAASTACELNSFTINGFVGTIADRNVTVKVVEGYDFSHTPVMSVSSLAEAAWDAVNKKVTVTAESGATAEYAVVAAAEAIQPYRIEAEQVFSFAAATYTVPVEWMYGTSWSETMKGCTAADKDTAIGGYEIKQVSGSNADGIAKGEAYTAAGSIYLHIYVSNCATLKLSVGATGGRTLEATVGGVKCGELTLIKNQLNDFVCTVNSADPVVVTIAAPGATGGTRVYSMTATPYQGGNSIDSEVAENAMVIYAADGMLHVSASEAQAVNVYGIDGRLVRVAELVEGDNTIGGLAKGMYLVNNQKVVIK